MENILFCGGCGGFISADEISAGKASKINNIYYCLKCSTGQNKPRTSQQGIPSRAGSITSAGNKAAIKPAPTPVPSRQTTAPIPQKPATIVPPRQTTAQIAQKPATIISPRQTTAQIAQKPATTSNRPAVVSQPKPIDTKTTIPVPKQTSHTTRRIPIEEIQETRPITRKTAPPKSVTRFSIKPLSSDSNLMNTEDRPPTRRFTPAPPAKTGMKKIYIIGGAVVVVAIILILVITSIISSKKEEQKQEDTSKKLKQYYQEIEEAVTDFPDEPKKVLAIIEERMDSFKNSNYEKEVKKIEATAKEQLDIQKKLSKLNASPATTKEEIDERLQEYVQLRSTAGEHQKILEKINETIKTLKQEKQKIIDEEKRAEGQSKKDFDEFKSKTDKLKEQKSYKDMLEVCKEFLAKPGNSKFQEEVEKVKADAQKAIDEITQAKADRLKEQILTDDSTKWTRQGASNAEFSVDDKNQMVLKNPSGNPQGQLVLLNNNNSENWKDFTLQIEFKIVSGSFDMGLKGIEIPFKRSFKVEWYKYTIRVKGDELTISGTELSESKKLKVAANASPIIIVAKPGDEIIIKELKAKIIE